MKCGLLSILAFCEKFEIKMLTKKAPSTIQQMT